MSTYYFHPSSNSQQPSNERINYSHFANALRKGYVPLSQEVLYDERVVKWAYNVALTRFHEVWQPSRQKLIAPMVDMLNHSSEPNCEITFDMSGNCAVTAMYDVPPGSPLTISLGDPTNPTPLFAQSPRPNSLLWHLRRRSRGT